MIEILIGNIASGKSTYAKLRAQQGAIIIDHDSIVTMVHGNYQLFDRNLIPLYRNIEHQAATIALAMGKDIIIDRTCHSPKHRQSFISLAQTWNVPIVAVLFAWERPEVHAHRRFSHDSRGYSYEKWLTVAQGFNEKYIPPSLDEGFSEIRLGN